MDALEILRPGLLTTVQDRGRFGCQQYGVPVSGAVDDLALRVANLLVGNPETAAGLEMTVAGPRLRIVQDVVLALTGAEFMAELDGQPVPWYESFHANRGQELNLRGCRRGVRGYLAVGGGIDVPTVLGSRSTCLAAHFGGFQGRALAVGDRLPVIPRPGAPEEWTGRSAPRWLRPEYPPTAPLRVVLGPQDAAFTEEGVRVFLESTYRVTPRADRMGCRLDGPPIAHRGSADIISDWVPMGGVQVPGDGKPIVLLADRQTTGGYPKIATVIGPDIRVMAQRRPGEAVCFRAISAPDAQQAAREEEAAVTDFSLRVAEGRGRTKPARSGQFPDSVPA